MPIKPENLGRYPATWPQIRAAILERARHRCEQCGVHDGSLGGRLPDGRFLLAWPTGERLLRTEWPVPGATWWCGDPGGQAVQLRIIRIVLTVAHLDHTPEHCDGIDQGAPVPPIDRSNLRAWCQRCHLQHDAEHHARNARETRRRHLAVGDLFDAQYLA